MKAPELDAEALLERIAIALGECFAVGTLSRKTGVLRAAMAFDDFWEDLLSEATGSTPMFPGARVGAVAALLRVISQDGSRAAHFEQSSLAAENTRIVLQRCPWNEREVLFVVLPDEGAAMTFALLRLVLEAVRRDVSIVRAPRVEERCWN